MFYFRMLFLKILDFLIYILKLKIFILNFCILNFMFQN